MISPGMIISERYEIIDKVGSVEWQMCTMQKICD